MAKDIKKEIIAELDRRMDLLREHQYDQIQITGNEYSELNQALSKVIGAPCWKSWATSRTLYKAFKKTRGKSEWILVSLVVFLGIQRVRIAHTAGHLLRNPSYTWKRFPPKKPLE